MLVSFLILLVVTLAVAAYARMRHPAAFPEAGAFTRDQGLRLAARMPFALIAAQSLAELIPDDAVGAMIGAQSGITGILIASFAGGLLPGGPMVSFPIALVLAGEGAGIAQLTALITGWSVFAFHRVISYESPIMGWRFVALRLISSLAVPPAAGLLVMGVQALTGGEGITVGR